MPITRFRPKTAEALKTRMDTLIDAKADRSIGRNTETLEHRKYEENRIATREQNTNGLWETFRKDRAETLRDLQVDLAVADYDKDLRDNTATDDWWQVESDPTKTAAEKSAAAEARDDALEDSLYLWKKGQIRSPAWLR